MDHQNQVTRNLENQSVNKEKTYDALATWRIGHSMVGYTQETKNQNLQYNTTVICYYLNDLRDLEI